MGQAEGAPKALAQYWPGAALQMMVEGVLVGVLVGVGVAVRVAVSDAGAEAEGGAEGEGQAEGSAVAVADGRPANIVSMAPAVPPE